MLDLFEKKYVISSLESGKRLDVFLESTDPSFSRSQFKNQIVKGKVLVNGKIVKAGYKLRENDEVTAQKLEIMTTDIVPEDIKLNIIYEDKDLLVINKPQNMVVHPAAGNYSGTLVNALLFKFNANNLSNVNGEDRPGIVHRLDKDTSGLIVIAKNNKTHLNLSSQFKDRVVKKYYLALLNGNLKQDFGEVQTLINRDKNNRLKMAVSEEGRAAVTLYRVLKRFEGYCLVEFELITGRTHQLRVHSKHLGHPIVGDELYGFKDKLTTSLKGQLLHSHKLQFSHPTTNEVLSFEAELPEEFSSVLNSLTEI